jgi:Glycosyl transferase family 2
VSKRVAVWLTNYNNEKHIAKALESIASQDHDNFRCFIFDNHSTDGAPAVIDWYTSTYPRLFEKVPMPPGLAGIPAMKFAWEFLDTVDADYSITIGGHDYWPQTNHLSTLVGRFEAEYANRPDPIALIYTDVWQVNEEDQVCGRFNNILQQGGNMPLQFVPQWVVSGIDCPPFFGMWDERVRRQVPVRYTCAGWDHLVVTHASVKGLILWEPRTVLRMRAPPPGDGPEGYGRRHFSKAALTTKHQDFINQIEWLTQCVDEACAGQPDLVRLMLTASMFSNYVCLRGYNLGVFPGGVDAFNDDPKVREAMSACIQAGLAVRRLTGRQ